MQTAFFIPGPLPGENDIIAACKGAGGSGRIYSALKRSWTDAIAAMTMRQARFVGPTAFRFDWIERDRRRDPDNIIAGRKFILDGLTPATDRKSGSGVITGDGWGNIIQFTDTWQVGSKPGVLVTIEG